MANLAPMLGLLGTVAGLIDIFGVLGEGNNVGDPSVLASGVSEALVNTAAGLAVAVPAMLFHHIFSKRAQRFILRMERASLEVLEVLGRTLSAPGPEARERLPVGGLAEI